PNRRHQCELCSSIFECHLCKIGNDSTIHVNKHNRNPKHNVLVCLTCAKKKKMFYVAQQKDRHLMCIYDYFTGKGVIVISIQSEHWLGYKRWFQFAPRLKWQLKH